MSDTGDQDDVEAIKERKKAELAARAETDEPVHVEGRGHLDDLLADNEVVLVDFYADWCGPCQMLEPAIESIAEETAATVTKVDVDAHQQLAREYSVQGVPALFLFDGGEPAERLVGMQDEATLVELVEEYV